LIRTAGRWSLLLFGCCFIDIFITGVILHPYLPITATTLQRPLYSVPKVAVAERFDCNGINIHLSGTSGAISYKRLLLSVTA